MGALPRWYHTLRPLKAAQWWYRAAWPLVQRMSKLREPGAQDLTAAKAWRTIHLASLHVAHSYKSEKRQFCLLNRCAHFPDGIDWNFGGEGLLWTYTLNYFEWLYDDVLSVENRLATIRDFVATKKDQSVAQHAYPISLRAVSWIRFILRFGLNDDAVLHRLWRDVDWLCRFPEYQLDGNHLWENAVAILCAGHFFQKEDWQKTGLRLLKDCIGEQVLPDGGHIEGSPMYHSLLLWRLLQCIELMRALSKFSEPSLEDAAARMLGWMKAMTFRNGSWPHFNDSAPGIAPTSLELLRYAAQCGITQANIPLKESGYRFIRCGDFELAVDASPIRPVYQPGHSHADIGSFCLHFKEQPVIVDTGTSTYEPGAKRDEERGTGAHNTLCIGGKNSSEVWKSFRIGRRAKLLYVDEGEGFIHIAYSPYTTPALVHQRTFRWDASSVQITDELSNESEGSIARLHFHPTVVPELSGTELLLNNGLRIQVRGISDITIVPYRFAAGFNALQPALRACFEAPKHLIVKISSSEN